MNLAKHAGLLATAGLMTLLTASAVAGPACAEEYEWSIDLDCSICHASQYEGLGLVEAPEAAGEPAATAEAEEKADAEPTGAKADGKDEPADEAAAYADKVTGFAAMHAQNFGLTCTSCHEDTPDLAAGHKKLNSGKTPSRLKKSSVSEDVCLTCHKSEALAEATAEVTVLTDDKGTVVNPHDLPANDDHAALTCFSCHTVHPGEEDGIEEKALATCVSCHHEKVFECGTCH